nr:putative ribonuclease H-like domain-containing protein [Tanacetum cinerariifolium]
MHKGITAAGSTLVLLDKVGAAAEILKIYISAASSKATVSTLSNVDSLSDAVIYSFFASYANSLLLDNEDLKQIDLDDLKEMDLKWQMAMLTKRVRRECRSPRDNRNRETTRRTIPAEVSTLNALVSQCDAVGGYDWSFQSEENPTNYALMAYTSSSSSSSSESDNEVAPCSKACSKAYATLQTHYDNLTVEFRKSQLDVLSYKIELRKKFEKAKKERNDLKLTLDKFQTSSKNLQLHSHESDNKVPKNPENDRYKIGEGYHDVPPPYTRTFMPPKHDLVFTNDPTASESIANVFNMDFNTHKPSKDMSKTYRPDAPIVKDWISDFEYETEIESVPKQREPSFVKSTEYVKSTRESVKKLKHNKQAENLRINNQKSRVKHVVNKAHSPIRRPINQRTVTKNSNFNKKVTTVKVNKVNVVQDNKGNAEKASAYWVWKPNGNPQQALQDKGVIDSRCSRHMTGNISFLSDFNEIDGGYVEFGGNPKGDNKCVVLSSDYKLPDENHVLLRVSRENNMYNVDLKNVVHSGGLTCLFSKATLDDSNLWHRRLGHINFKTMNKLVKGNLVRGLPSKIFKNNHTCVACKKGKQHKASCKSKPVSSISQPLQRVLVTKPHNKTPYELLLGRSPSIGFMRPFGCPVTILNTLDPLEMFDEKADEGFLVGYSVNYKAFKVFNSRIRIVQETLHINFLENKPNVAGIGSKWLFDIDTLTMSMNYQPVFAGNQPNDNAGIKENLVAGKVRKETISAQQYVLLPLWSTGLQDPQNTDDVVADATFDVKKNKNDVYVSANGSDNTDNKKHDEKAKRDDKGKSHADSLTGHCSFNIASPSVNAVSPNFGIAEKSSFVDPSKYPDDPDMLELEDIVYSDDEEDVGAEADLSNLETNIPVSPILTTRVYKDYLFNQIIGDLNSAPQTRSMTRMVKEQDLPKGKRAIGSKWVFRNKKDEKGIVIRNKARLVAQGHTQEEGINYDEVFAPVARIEVIRLFLAYVSFMGFMLYQMDVKSAFIYGTIEEEVYVCQPLGFEDLGYLDKVYKVVKALYGLHQAPRAWYETLANYLLENGFQRGKIDQALFIKKKNGDILLVEVFVDDIVFGSTNKELYKAFEKLMKDKFQMSSMGELTFFLGLQVKQKDDEIFISQDKYIAEISRKFGFTDVKSASTHIKTDKPLLKDPYGENVDVHIYRSMIGSLMYLTSSRPDIMFAVCACVRFQVTPKVSHLHAVKKFFRYLKVNVARHFITAVSDELMLFGLMKVVVVNLMLLDTSEGFDQIVDFLNAHTIKYALVVNPTIYVPCIKQFWATATIKKVNDDVQLCVLIDGNNMVVSKAIIRRDLHLDDADMVECFPNTDIFEELARMGYEKHPSKLIFYKAFFSAQWKFLIHTLVYMDRNVDSLSKFLMYPHFLQVIMDHQVDDMTTHNTMYTSPTLTQKVFANIRRVGKGFSCVETPLFASMLVQPQPQAEEDVEIPIDPTPPSTTNAPSPSDHQDTTPTPHATPLQDQPLTLHDSPPHDQPTTPHESTIPLLTTLMETCATLSQKVAELEKDKHSQALEILQLKKRVKKLERKKEIKVFRVQKAEKGRKIEAIDADEGITLVDVKTDKEVVAMNAESRGRLNQEDVIAAEPTVFDDEDVTMKMAQNLIKLKAKKAKLLDEQIAQKLHDEEVQKAAARDKQEKANMERALELQRQYDDKEENID